jgi:hypothetical protein
MCVVDYFVPQSLEQNLKNASSWSSLASSPSTNNTAALKSSMADSFQAFKKQAKENAKKQRALIEQQEMRRVAKEAQERERKRLENEKRREKEEEEALEKVRCVAPWFCPSFGAYSLEISLVGRPHSRVLAFTDHGC